MLDDEPSGPDGASSEGGSGVEGRRPTVALVLGSGGARGYAHIGVVQVLEERGFDIVAIAGSSMGAVVGGLQAAGQLDEFTEWALGLGQFEILRYMDLSLSSPGAIRGEKAFKVVSDLVGDLQIEDLPIPFTAVAVDLLAQREVWFQEGPLDVAVRASAAIPSFFVPVTLNGRVLVDGGVLNPVPVAPVATVPVDHVIAVTLNGRGPSSSRPVAETAEEDEAAEWTDRMRDTAARWFDSDLLATVRRRMNTDDGDEGDVDVPHVDEGGAGSDDELATVVDDLLSGDTEVASAPDAHEGSEDDDVPDEPARRGRTSRKDRAERREKKAKVDKPDRYEKDELGAVDVLQLSFDAMQGALTRHRLAGYSPDLLISVPKNAVRTLDMHRAEEMITLGRLLAEDALDRAGLGSDRAEPGGPHPAD